MRETMKAYHALNDELKALDGELEKSQTRLAGHQGKMDALAAQLAEAEADQAAMVRRFLNEEVAENVIFTGQSRIDELTSQARSLEQIKVAIVGQIAELQARRNKVNECLVRDRYKFFAVIAKAEFAKIAAGLARSYAAHRRAGMGGMEFGAYVRECTNVHRDLFRDEALRATAEEISRENKM
jgi:uncharacterized coiled-coil DUF342 family protein